MWKSPVLKLYMRFEVLLFQCVLVIITYQGIYAEKKSGALKKRRKTNDFASRLLVHIDRAAWLAFFPANLPALQQVA